MGIKTARPTFRAHYKINEGAIEIAERLLSVSFLSKLFYRCYRCYRCYPIPTFWLL